MSGTNARLIEEARRAAEEEVGYDTGDGLLYSELAAALEAAEAERATEWGVRIMGKVSPCLPEEQAREDVAWWAEWEANKNPDPKATKFPRELVSRTAASAWEAAK